MEVYAVGGSVRDELLGLTPQDFDYVVTGATHAEMIKRGFEKVGASFPVYLHPTSGDEWALARKERKIGPGYHGFEVDASAEVTIEEDLARRDLTINSIARHTKTDVLVDPYDGQADLKRKVLRHTSEAFAEDPLRVIRLARFAARFPDFTIAPETLQLCHTMVLAGKLNELSQERIWLEVMKALDSAQPLRFFQVLAQLEMPQAVKGLRPLNSMFAFVVEGVLDYAKAQPEEERHAFILAALIHYGRDDVTEAEARGLPAGTLTILDILQQDWRDLDNMVLNVGDVLQRLVKVGALRKLWPKARRIIYPMDQRIDVELYDKLVAAVNAVGPNMDLTGKELGEDLRARRIAAMKAILGPHRKHFYGDDHRFED